MFIWGDSGVYMDKPLKILHGSLNNRVMVELRNGIEFTGILDGYDVPHMNLVLKNADETVHSEQKTKHQSVILRGDNIIYISP
jgi:small nuclear ribonucleoprotein